MKKSVELVVKTECQLGEGPSWDDRTNTLYFLDLIGNRIYYYDIAKDTLDFMDVGQNTGCAIPCEKGGLIAGLQNGVYYIDPHQKKMELLVQPERGISGNRFNDGKCDAAGRLWAGTMSKTLDTGYGDYIPRGSLYCIDTDMNVSKQLSYVTISNGLAWSKDNRTMYYIDTPTKKLTAFDFDLTTGAITGRRTAIDFSKYSGQPDGMCIDSEDRLWIAFFGESMLRYCDPQSGEVLEEVLFPVLNVTCAAFGGDDLKDLYVTTGNIDTPVDQYPLAGSVFKIRTEVPGMPLCRFGKK